MTGDLGRDGPQVHARDILDFWFGLTPQQHFAKDDALDRMIADRFAVLRARVLADDANGWRDDPDTLLAAIILLDQFSRNIGRGTPAAFEADGLAARLTLAAIEKGWEDRYAPSARIFLYMPLMHAEDRAIQDLSVARFDALGVEENANFARDHRDVLHRFGRFPGRNAALGRQSSAEEQEWLQENGGGW